MSLRLSYTTIATNTTIGVFLAGTGNATINWGDSSSNTYTLSAVAQYTHVYSAIGTYTVDISGSNITQLGNGTVAASGIQLLTSVLSFGNVGLTTLNGSFYSATGFSNSNSIPTSVPSTVTFMQRLFQSSNINDTNITNWNVSNVTDFTAMFVSATSFNVPINWTLSNTGNITMANMFNGATLYNQDISWNTNVVSSMSGMFTSATAFNKNINSWNVSNVNTFAGMFSGATAYNNGGVPLNWTLKNAGTINMSTMFSGATAFNQDISWNTGVVSTVANMFQNAAAFNRNCNSWSVSNVSVFTSMFAGAAAYNNGGSPLYWTLKNTGTIQLNTMFSGATAFNQDISWNTDVVITMSNMFQNATAFNKNCSSWNVGNVTVFTSMFNGATSYNNGGSPLYWTLKTSGTINMNSMFNGATSFNQYISWNSGFVNNMNSMFSGATAFNSNCNSWDVSSVTNFNAMFQNAAAFNNGAAALTTNTAPLTWSLNTSGALKTILMSNMFSGATSFSQDISSLNIKNVSDMTAIFTLNNTSMTSTLFNNMLNAWAALAPNIPVTPFTFSAIKYTSGGATSLGTLQGAPYSWTTTARSVTYTPTSVNWGASFSLVYTVVSANSVSGHSYKLVNSNNPSVTVSTFVSTGQASYTFPNVVLQDYNYSTLYIIDNSINAIVDSVNINTVFPCFKEGTKILTIHGYVPIENLRKGDLVKTPLNEYKPVYMIGKKVIYNHALQEREKNQLYVCSKDNYPEVFEDLVITGCHSILVDGFASDKQKEETFEINGDIYITPVNCVTYETGKYRLPACVDERATVLDKEGPFTIYHISLENDSYTENYGIYANGLLVETCSKRYLKELSHMNHIDEIE